MAIPGEWHVTTPSAGGLGVFVDELLACCPMIRSVWLVGDAAGGPEAARLPRWDVIVFADALTLHRLRKTAKLHRGDVRLRVLVDGNRLESAWERIRRDEATLASEWRQSSPGEGYYTESVAEQAQAGRASRRRHAVCLWQGIDPMKGPGS